MLESSHVFKALRDDSTPLELSMKRTLYKKVGQNYILLKIQYTNTGSTPVKYLQAFGDEPWVGDFKRGSEGNVGWTCDSLYERSTYISPEKYGYAGFWDYGNESANERHVYTGYADFVEWFSPRPDFVYFSNGFKYPDKKREVLDSPDNRTIQILWVSQTLKPGESRTYELALGMAVPHGTILPVKPQVEVPAGF
jgi:hypothetical protein